MDKESGMFSSLTNMWEKGQDLYERGRAAWELGKQEPIPRWQQRLYQLQNPWMLNPDGSEMLDDGRKIRNPNYNPAIRSVMHPDKGGKKPGRDWAVGNGTYFMDRRKPSPEAEIDSSIMDQISEAEQQANETGNVEGLVNLENQGIIVQETTQPENNENRNQQNLGKPQNTSEIF